MVSFEFQKPELGNRKIKSTPNRYFYCGAIKCAPTESWNRIKASKGSNLGMKTV